VGGKLQQQHQNLPLEPGNVTAIILAAGVGKRLGESHNGPKVLLDFSGRSLIERHLGALAACGICDVAITVGHEADTLMTAVKCIDFPGSIHFVKNSDYHEGSLISLWHQNATLRSGKTVILMDGDVLYDGRMIERLLTAAPENVLMFDEKIEEGDEPVKICFKDGILVDFRKKPANPYDRFGESVGFFRFSPDMAAKLAARCDSYVQAGKRKIEYEEAIRDLILLDPSRFGIVDISDLPWTEIDFESDIIKARNEILPQLTS